MVASGKSCGGLAWSFSYDIVCGSTAVVLRQPTTRIWAAMVRKSLLAPSVNVRYRTSSLACHSSYRLLLEYCKPPVGQQ